MLNDNVKDDDTNSYHTANDELNEIKSIGFFEKYLTIWVLLCLIIGTVIGNSYPIIGQGINSAQVYNINFPMTILLWLMIFPMTLDINFESLKQVSKNPKPIFITTTVNYLFQPFIVYGLSLLFFKVIFSSLIKFSLQEEFIAGSGAPCTAMVFVWSYLVEGDSNYTLIQVAVNDILILILYYPTLILLLNTTSIPIPYETLALSIVLYVIVPFSFGAIIKKYFVFSSKSKSILKIITTVSLLATLLLIFLSLGHQIVEAPLNVIYICFPLILQTYISAFLAYFLMYLFKVKSSIAGPGGMIASSNFFELAVGVTVSTYGTDSGATLVGVLTEVPCMLSIVYIFNKYLKKYYNN